MIFISFILFSLQGKNHFIQPLKNVPKIPRIKLEPMLPPTLRPKLPPTDLPKELPTARPTVPNTLLPTDFTRRFFSRSLRSASLAASFSAFSCSRASSLAVFSSIFACSAAAFAASASFAST